MAVLLARSPRHHPQASVPGRSGSDSRDELAFTFYSGRGRESRGKRSTSVASQSKRAIMVAYG